jgi:hypothetical protein
MADRDATEERRKEKISVTGRKSMAIKHDEEMTQNKTEVNFGF